MAGDPEQADVAPGEPAAEPVAGSAADTGPPEPAAEGEALSRWNRREKAAADALRTFVRDLYTARFGMPQQAMPWNLQLRLRAEVGDTWALAFDPPLAAQLDDQLQDAHAVAGAYRDGAVFCFKCESSTCEHATPPAPAAVFAGYDPMGLAEWKELHQVFLEEKDERVDRFFDDRPGVFARVQLGKALRVRQLPAFGRSSRSYAVLGQVVAGYLAPARRRAGAEAPARYAITFQVVETREAGGAFGLHVNTLCAAGSGAALSDWMVDQGMEAIRRARDGAAREVERLRDLVRGAREAGSGADARDVLARVPGILRRLAASIERGGRQEQRRTAHARQRREDRRPVHKAHEDALAARLEHCFMDEKTGTIVVCGASHRAHVFNPDGPHVTSFQLSPGQAEFRVRTRRWRPAAADELSGLQRALRAVREPDG